MSRNYEGVIVLDTKGREEGIDELTRGITGLFEQKGASIESTEHLGRKDFAYAPDKVTGGQFVKLLFAVDPARLDDIREALELRDEVHYQAFERLS